MKVLYINNDASGFADYIEVAEATTLGQLFHDRIPNAKAENYLIRVDRQPAAACDVLRERPAHFLHTDQNRRGLRLNSYSGAKA